MTTEPFEYTAARAKRSVFEELNHNRFSEPDLTNQKAILQEVVTQTGTGSIREYMQCVGYFLRPTSPSRELHPYLRHHELSDSILEGIDRGENQIVWGSQCMGKTCLVKDSCLRLREKEQRELLYINILYTNTAQLQSEHLVHTFELEDIRAAIALPIIEFVKRFAPDQFRYKKQLTRERSIQELEKDFGTGAEVALRWFDQYCKDQQLRPLIVIEEISEFLAFGDPGEQQLFRDDLECDNLQFLISLHPSHMAEKNARELLTGYHNHLIPPIHLGQFSLIVEQFLEHTPFRFSEGAVEFLYSFTGGNPGYLNYALSELFEENLLPEKIIFTDQDLVESLTMLMMSHSFQQVIDRNVRNQIVTFLNPREREILQAIFDKTYIEADEDQEHLNRLKRLNFIYRRKNSKHSNAPFEFCSGCFQMMFNHHNPNLDDRSSG